MFGDVTQKTEMGKMVQGLGFDQIMKSHAKVFITPAAISYSSDPVQDLSSSIYACQTLHCR